MSRRYLPGIDGYIFGLLMCLVLDRSVTSQHRNIYMQRHTQPFAMPCVCSLEAVVLTLGSPSGGAVITTVFPSVATLTGADEPGSQHLPPCPP